MSNVVGRIFAACSSRGAFRHAALAVGLAATLLSVSSDPADARRRHHGGGGGGGYSPPYAAIVVDVKSGRTLHAVNEDALRHPASITKVMTLYMLFEQIERGRYDLQSPLTISDYAAARAPSKLGLRPGSTITVEEAILALVTKSANDVACAIGENIAGSESRFGEMMTQRARSLGMTRTNFANASGLPDPDQITTARDLAVLARAIQDRYPRYFRYFQARSFAFRGRSIGNHNKLLGRVEGVDGIKTGYTRDSGFNLMTSARIGERQIVAIVLGGKSGASRDRIMADLVRAHLPTAYAGARQSAPVGEMAERSRPAVVADAGSRTRTLHAAEEERVQVTSSTSGLAAPATTTPGMRWKPGAQAVPAAPLQASATAAPTKQTVKLASVDGTIPRGLFKADSKPETGKTESAKSDSNVKPSAWVVQLGAMDDEDKAKATLAEARQRCSQVAKSSPITIKVVHGGTTLYRARLSGFSEQSAAQDACAALKKNGFSCFATRS